MHPRRGSWRELDRCLGLRQLKPSKNLECRKGPRNATQAYRAGVGRNRHSLVLSALLMVAFAYSFNNQRSIEFQGRREMALALENFALYVERQSLESRKYS